MDFYNDFSLGANRELGRLDVRIDDRPLVCPILTHSINSVDVAAFHSICPHDVLVHGSEHALHVASVEPIVNTLQKFHFIRHLKSPFILSTVDDHRFSHDSLLHSLILPASPLLCNA